MAINASELVQDLARLHQRQLVRAMAMVCGDVAEAEDAVQEAFAALWQVLECGQVVTSPKSWLTVACMNRLRSGWRRGAVRARYLQGIMVEGSTDRHQPDLADALTVREELSKLPQRQRQAAVLYYYMDFSLEDAATAMATSTGTVKNLLFRP